MWDAAKAEIRKALAERARIGKTISYSELVKTIRAIRFEPTSRALAAMLCEVSAAENARGRGMLSVIVVHSDGDMQPGSGFFELAEALGRDTSDKLKCWVTELDTVHRNWSLSLIHI